MPHETKKKAPVSVQLAEAVNRNPFEGDPMSTTVPHPSDNFDAQFILNAGRNRVWVQPATCGKSGASIIELTDEFDSNLLMKPSEALTVAAALTAVATHVLEEESRFIFRRTEPGQPSFEGAL